MGKLRPRGGRSQLKVTEESEAEPQSLDSCTRVLKYALEKDFMETLAKCREVTMESLKGEKLFYRIVGPIVKFIAPLF